MKQKIIVYQYGKVASSALVESLNGLENVEAFQCHFLGEKAFSAILARLCKPATEDYFFDNSLGQLHANIRAYRSYLRRDSEGGEPCKILTVARHPFDWFRSAIIQEIEGHLPAFTRSLGLDEKDEVPDEQIVTEGLQLLLHRILLAFQVIPNVDGFSVARRLQLKESIEFKGQSDFDDFLFLLGRFLMPHFWFANDFFYATGIKMTDWESVDDGLWCARGSEESVFLIKYEFMQEAFSSFLSRAGLPSVALQRVNEGSEKLFAEEVNAVFKSPTAQELKLRSVSAASEAFGHSQN